MKGKEAAKAARDLAARHMQRVGELEETLRAERAAAKAREVELKTRLAQVEGSLSREVAALADQRVDEVRQWLADERQLDREKRIKRADEVMHLVDKKGCTCPDFTDAQLKALAVALDVPLDVIVRDQSTDAPRDVRRAKASSVYLIEAPRASD